jgi:UDP-galactopyranose mutase
MNKPVAEGSHRHTTEEQTCFFCLGQCKNWTAYQLRIHEGSHQTLKNAFPMDTTQAFVMCYRCRDEKPEKEIIDAIAEHALMEERVLKKSNTPVEKLIQTDLGRKLLHGRQRLHRGKR